jgi:prepilin-type N-terminal cleavage/methylation domain-containing protein/prepilin-type processing-associated H-X9-DG protein
MQKISDGLRPTGAFSLIELLVTLAIVGVLVATLSPAVSGALVNGKQAACASNLRQVGLAMMAYAGDNDLRLPETSHTAAIGQTWITLLAPYLEDMDKVRICPADPKGPQRLAAGGTSYVLNSFLFVPEMDPFGELIGPPTNDLKRIPQPSRTFMAFVCSDSTGVGPGNDHTHSSGWTSWEAVTRDIAPDRFAVRRSPDRTAGASNYLFADGHGETLRAADLKARVLSGENIAEPR